VEDRSDRGDQRRDVKKTKTIEEEEDVSESKLFMTGVAGTSNRVARPHDLNPGKKVGEGRDFLSGKKSEQKTDQQAITRTTFCVWGNQLRGRQTSRGRGAPCQSPALTALLGPMAMT
jgi:hypothetical protein